MDQRVTLWTLKEEQLEMRAQVLSHVPQIQSMAVWKQEDIFICVVGFGAQVFRIKNSYVSDDVWS